MSDSRSESPLPGDPENAATSANTSSPRIPNYMRSTLRRPASSGTLKRGKNLEKTMTQKSPPSTPPPPSTSSASPMAEHVLTPASTPSPGSPATPRRATMATMKKGKIEDHAGDCVMTLIRCKPLKLDQEGSAGEQFGGCISVNDSRTEITLTDKENTFMFDHVCPETTNQEEIFDLIGRPIADCCMRGINGTMMCYGQTGSGKTHTMLGSTVPGDAEAGLIPRCFDYIFSQIAAIQANPDNQRAFTVKLSVFQIYNNRISDLLVQDVNVKDNDLKLRESEEGDVWVEGLTEQQVWNPEAARKLVDRGVSHRRVGSTKMNDESSRSHCIVTMSIASKRCGVVQTARLQLIDLAGSESQKYSQASSQEQFGEACNINLSLTYLGAVMREVAEGKKFVNFRNSKLTHLLKPSLGGNTKTCVVSNISSCNKYYTETLSTLRFASQLKFIRNNAKVNERAEAEVTKAEVMRWKAEANRLEDELAKVTQQLEEANTQLEAYKSGAAVSNAATAAAAPTTSPSDTNTSIPASVSSPSSSAPSSSAPASSSSTSSLPTTSNAALLTQELADARAKFDAELSSLKKELESTVQKRDEEKGNYESEISSLKKELESANQKLDAELGALREQLAASLRRESDEKGKYESEVAAMNKNLEDGKSALASRDADLVKAKQEIETLQAEVAKNSLLISSSTNEYAVLQGDFKAAQAENSVLKLQLATSAKQLEEQNALYTASQSKLNESREATNKAQTELAKVQALLAELTIKLVTKEAEQADSMQRLKDKDREIEQMQQQCTKSKGELSAVELEREELRVLLKKEQGIVEETKARAEKRMETATNLAMQLYLSLKAT